MMKTIQSTEMQSMLADMSQQFKSTTDYDLYSKSKTVHLFATFGFEDKRATVIHISAIGINQALKSLERKAKELVDTFPMNIKIDVVTEKRSIDILSFIELITRTKKNYFRFGLSFDKTLSQAFLEQELNGNAMIQISPKNKRGYLHEANIQTYITMYRPDMNPIDFNKISELYLFSTKGYFFDGKQLFSLHYDELNHGRRDTPLNRKELCYLVDSGQNYLTSLSKESGQFTYGYFSCFDKEIKFYNMLRHASTLFSMIEAYEFNPTLEAKKTIENGLTFLINNALYVDDTNDIAYIIDGLDGNQEIKLGANAAAILAFTKYMDAFQDSTYLQISVQLANGILRLQHENGSFTHVLHYPSLKVKERFRIVYYDGEAAFALMRLYRIQKNEQWLQAVEKAFDYFIQEQYWKNHDHWLSYCTNELTMYRPLEKYFQFGLDNAKGKLHFIYHRITTYPTFLELTVATYKMIQRMKQTNFAHLLNDFDEEYLIETIHTRAEYQRNGFFYPELAMYYKNPKRITGSFFIRHHSFRTRIDDVEHYLSGYIAYCEEFHPQ